MYFNIIMFHKDLVFWKPGWIVFFLQVSSKPNKINKLLPTNMVLFPKRMHFLFTSITIQWLMTSALKIPNIPYLALLRNNTFLLPKYVVQWNLHFFKIIFSSSQLIVPKIYIHRNAYKTTLIFGLGSKCSMSDPIFDGKYFCCEIWELLSENLLLIIKPMVRGKQK